MTIDVAELWSYPDSVLLDVRTPAEFAKGHIPGAINFPIFSDEERKVVGTVYKQQSPEKALVRGLDLVGPKMSRFVTEARRLAGEKTILLHCWRGGKRSESMSWLLRLAGLRVKTLKGGYKAYRNFILTNFQQRSLTMRILGGKTGCGKTLILRALREKGAQIIDLEGLARHKGSAFGALGEAAQTSTEQFENDLYEAFRQIDPDQTVWVENENRLIGKLFIPEGFWRQMKTAPLINIERSLEQRVEIILQAYGSFPPAAIQKAFEKIKKRIGGQNMQLARQALAQNDLATAIKIALYYYDKAYQYYLDKNTTEIIRKVTVSASTETVADQLINLNKVLLDEPTRYA